MLRKKCAASLLKGSKPYLCTVKNYWYLTVREKYRYLTVGGQEFEDEEEMLHG
jgi:hypothetical protein